MVGGSGFAAMLLAVMWGFAWALVLWLTPPGRFLRLRMTWLSVVIGIGVDLLVVLMVVELTAWLWTVGVIGASAVGIIGFAIGAGEYSEHRREMSRAGSE